MNLKFKNSGLEQVKLSVPSCFQCVSRLGTEWAQTGELQKELAFFFYSSISLIPESVLHWCYCDHHVNMSLYWWFIWKFLLKGLFLSSNFKIIDLEATKYLYYFKLKSIWFLESLFWQMARTSKQTNPRDIVACWLSELCSLSFFTCVWILWNTSLTLKYTGHQDLRGCTVSVKGCQLV